MLSSAKLMGGGLATMGLTGAGIGIGIVFGCMVMAMSRNPSLEGSLFSYAIMGFALTEAMALFVLMMAFLMLFS